jgi:hypothetical protein
MHVMQRVLFSKTGRPNGIVAHAGASLGKNPVLAKESEV